MMTRSATICPVTKSRAPSVLAVISPNPTVVNTVTVKYSASVCVSFSPKLLGRNRSHEDVGAGKQQQEQGKAGSQGLHGPQAREPRPDDPADLEDHQCNERHQPDDQYRDGDPGRGMVQRQQVVDSHQRDSGSQSPQSSRHHGADRRAYLTRDTRPRACAVSHAARLMGHPIFRRLRESRRVRRRLPERATRAPGWSRRPGSAPGFHSRC